MSACSSVSIECGLNLLGFSLADLGAIYVDLPDFVRAEPVFQRALAIFENRFGANHPRTAFVKARLARLYVLAGQRLKAEPLLMPALDVLEKTLGEDHLWLARALGALSTLRNDARDFDKSEEVVRRQIGIIERLEYTESTLYAATLNNLGELYARRRDYEKAKEYLLKSVAVQERLHDPDDYFLSNPLANLGIIAREEKDYATAEAYYLRAIGIRERLVGPDHPELMLLVNNLANIYHATGDYTRSLETHLRGLRIGEQAFGAYHQNTLLSVGNVARVSAAAGDLTTAIVFQRRADAIIERQLTLNLAVGSERQKLVFVRGMADRTDRTISLHLREAPGDADASALAALVLLQRKGRVLDAMIDTVAAVRQRIGSPSDRGLLDRLNATTAELARLALNPPEATHADERLRRIKELEATKEQLESELAEHSAAFRAEMQPVTLDAVQAAVPDDAALLEFAIYRPYDPKAERNADAYGPPHYAVYVVRRHAAPVGADLGPAAAIDEAIEGFREALRDRTRADLKPRARAVDELVMQPLRGAFGDARRLLISPDGALNLVPFDALVDEQGRYLIERYAMSYFTSGRDLLRLQVPRGNRTQPVIFADPVFGEPRPESAAVARTQPSSRALRGSVTTGTDLSTVYFAPLAASAAEARAIKALFPESTLFTGRRATKATMQQLDAPRMLHIASHGFFLQDTRNAAQPSAPAGSATRSGGATSGASNDATSGMENPLLRSGLALAGANLAQASSDAGILTALEASGLNLWGTKLVTLSGCDTGVGEVHNGEGVYGLRRAFVLAGTETLVMSLWPVTDGIARETMVAYYTGLRAGLGRGDALRQAKLAMLKRSGRQHPFYWASFIQSGEWASLDGTR
jgi:CHAT domain-containing protein